MAKHGVFTSEQATSVSAPAVANSGIPFVIGAAPVHSAAAPASSNLPVLVTSWDEALEKLGYSDNWADYNICEFIYSHFKLFGCQPVIVCNLLDPATMKQAVTGTAYDVTSHKVALPFEAINDETLVVKMAQAETPLVIDTDYAIYYSGENCCIELMKYGSAYEAASLFIEFNKVTPKVINTNSVVNGFEIIELCITTLGLVPDLICAPGYSQEATVAAVMATKAEGINGLFPAKALIDIPTTASGANEYNKVPLVKKTLNFNDKDEFVCWPLLKLGERTYHFSTQLAGVLAATDTENGGCPYVSPSNKSLKCDAMVTADGKEVNLSLAQANNLNANGVITALNFMGGWKCWGNYTACYPENRDVKDHFICVSRMFDWVANTMVRTFWAKVDMPMNRRLIDGIVDTCNIWLNGLIGAGYLLGARAEMREDENPTLNLMAGIIKIHIYMTPPTPAQEIDFVLEYDASYLETAFN